MIVEGGLLGFTSEEGRDEGGLVVDEGELLGFSGIEAFDFALATTADGSSEGGGSVAEATRFAGGVEESDMRRAKMAVKTRK